LKNKKSYNRLMIYKKGKLQKEYLLFYIPIIQKFVFLLLPIRSVIFLVEVFIYSIYLKHKFRKLDVYFTPNAFTAWIGNFMKGFGIVEKTVFWVWDYYPPINENKIIMFMRYVYWQFDKISSHSDRVAFVNKRLLDLRCDLGIYSHDKISDYPIVPIGTDRIAYKYSKVKGKKGKILFGFIGVLKKSLGPEIIFDHASALKAEFSDMGYEVVGSGPDEEYFKARAKKSRITTTFYGYLEEDMVNDVLKKCTIGIATYKPEESSVSQYGDPGKIKRYLSLGIPVITTNVLEFAKEIEKHKAGIVINYKNKYELVAAIKKIMARHAEYSRNAYLLSQKYYYKKIYPQMFGFK
jgi:glycosyltransferase involved in cell wall biosynthesis